MFDEELSFLVPPNILKYSYQCTYLNLHIHALKLRHISCFVSEFIFTKLYSSSVRKSGSYLVFWCVTSFCLLHSYSLWSVIYSFALRVNVLDLKAVMACPHLFHILDRIRICIRTLIFGFRFTAMSKTGNLQLEQFL